MLILLPPSEGKTAPASGHPLDIGALCYPELTPARERVLSSLLDASARPDACDVLGVSSRLAETVAANRTLRTAGTAPAIQVYSGVLYDALSPATWDAATTSRADEPLLLFSALFGVVRARDTIPAYRLSGSVNLPGIGPLGTFWRRSLGSVLTSDDLMIDCRSGTYAAMWRPAGTTPVRVFHEAKGRRTVVTHMAKQARGLVARALLTAPAPTSLDEAVNLLDAYFAQHTVTTATGALVHVTVERTGAALDVITR